MGNNKKAYEWLRMATSQELRELGYNIDKPVMPDVLHGALLRVSRRIFSELKRGICHGR